MNDIMMTNNMNDASCGIAYLSKKQIDSFCQALVLRFDPTMIKQPHPLNIERFLTEVLGARIGYENLSCDLSVMGAYISTNTDAMPIYNPETRRAELIHVPAQTVLLDRSLMRAGKTNRRRFTLAHEAGHAIWHSAYLRMRAAEHLKESCRVCDAGDLKRRKMPGALDEGEIEQLMEYQANRSASALLMPQGAMQTLMQGKTPATHRDEMEEYIILTAATFRVSDTAARIRLKELGYIREPKPFSISVMGQKLAYACAL